MKNYALAFSLALGLSLHGFGPARADPFLDEMVGFEGQMFIVQHKVPALVIAVVRDGEVSVKGFGERNSHAQNAVFGRPRRSRYAAMN